MEFAFVQDYESKINGLAAMCPENWSFGTQSDNIILKKYIDHTYLKLKEDNCIDLHDDHAIFNTGLYTTFYEPIFAYFEKHDSR